MSQPPFDCDRCMGECCAFMSLWLIDKDGIRRRLTPRDMEEARQQVREGEQLPNMNAKDSQQIADMIIDSGEVDEEGKALFTCRHYDRKGRRCSIYEDRPQMCRGYGVTHPCKHPGCRWKDAMHVAKESGGSPDA